MAMGQYMYLKLRKLHVCKSAEIYDPTPAIAGKYMQLSC